MGRGQGCTSTHAKAMANLTSAGPSQCPYHHHLQELDSRSAYIRGLIPHWLQQVSTPLRLIAWRDALQGHPDPVFVAYRHSEGFPYWLQEVPTLQPSLLEYKVSTRECTSCQPVYRGRTEVGLAHTPTPRTHMAPSSTELSPIGVIPKSSQPGKWRLIVDLSSPHGASVTDGIEPDLCSLEYLRLDKVTACIAKSGRETMLAKMNIASAYRRVPVHQ